MSEEFERKYIVKVVIFFATFCWLLDFLPENMRFCIIYFLVQISFFRAVLGGFSQCNANFFSLIK